MKPKLRFPEYNELLARRTIGNVLTIGSGKDYKHLKEGDIPVYGTGGLMTKVNGFLYEGESVGIGRKGTIDKPIFLYGKFWTVDTLFYTHSFKEVDPYYIYTIFQKINWHKYNEASGVPSLSKSTVGSIQVYIPKIGEQLRIRKFFEVVDRKIKLLIKKKQALEAYKKGLMQKIFSQELRFKREDGTDYPEWVFAKIGDHTFKVSEKNKKLEQLPIYSISNKGGFVPQSEQFEGVDSSERGYDISMYKIVGKNTFAYNPARINVGSFGYSGNLERVQISSLYVCFKVKPELSPFYLLQFMSSYEFSKSVLRNVEGGVRQYLFYDNFKNIRVPLPSLSEQEKIVQALIHLNGYLTSMENAIKKTEELKKGLLQQMFV